jgi:hypothetical protein
MSGPLDLNIDLNETDTAMPVLLPGLYDASVKSAEVSENNAKTGWNLVMQFELNEPATSVAAEERGDENDISPGFVLFKYYPMQQSDNEKAPDFKRDLAALQDACLGTERGHRGELRYTEFVGKPVTISTKIGKETNDYPASTEVKRVMARVS